MDSTWTKRRHRAGSLLAWVFRSGRRAFQTVVAPGVRASLSAFPRPTSPIAEPWELSIAALVGQHRKVPSIAAKLLRRLDQFGRVTIGPDRVGFDDKTVTWRKVIEIRTYATTDVVPSVVLDREIDRIREIFPPIPGRKWMVTKAANGMLTLIIAVAGHPPWQAQLPMLPCEIVYRNVLGRRATLPAGLFAAIVLAAIPEASHSLITTARTRSIPVRTMTGQTGATRIMRAEQARKTMARFGVRARSVQL
jgi:hypothetical protein